MAIQFDASKVAMFRNVPLADDDSMANLGGKQGLKSAGLYTGIWSSRSRTAAQKAANNAVRTELLKSLGQAFRLSGMKEDGGKVRFSKDFMDKLESYLGAAFKREDFGIGADGTVSSGKPLTQRRILAVERAVLDASGRLDAAVAAAKSVARMPYGLENDPRHGMIDSLIESAMKAAAGDEALTGLLQKKKVIEAVLVGNGIRTEEAVLAKVAAIKAGVDELRAATKGNRAMFEAGMRALANLGYNTFAPGCITAMVREASAAKIGDIRSLSGSSDAEDIHNAVAEYHKLTLSIMTKTNALSSFKSRSAEEYGNTRTFIGSLLLSRCSQTKLHALDDAFHSVSATKTSRLYNLIIEGRFEGDYSPRKIVAIKDTANRVAMTLLDIAANVSEALGDEPFAVNDFEGEPDQEMADARVFADIDEFADLEIAEENALRAEE